LGKGLAVKRGVLESTGRIVIYADSDLPYGLDAIDLFTEALRHGYDLAVGSRVEPDSYISGVPLGRRAMGRVFSWMIQALVMRGIPDTQCGFKALTRQAAAETFRRLTIPGFGFDVELLFVARKLGYRIRRVPVRMTNSASRRSSLSVFRDPWRMFRDLFAIRLNDSNGTYD
jgi:dolichyl-phosphate beta-glucosyltransferase